MAKYPKEWIATGHGSYRELRAGFCEITWRPAGTSGPRRRRTVECSPKEARDFLLKEAAARDRSAISMPVDTSWDDALGMYRSRLTAKNVVDRYAADVFSLLENLQQYAPNLTRVDPAMIQAWLDDKATVLKKNGRKGWASTANKHRIMISGFFQFLFRMRRLPFNPVSATYPFDETERPPRNISPEEYAKVWKISEPSVQDMLDFSLLTACRFGEMAALKSADISNGVWTCQDRKGNDYLRMALPAEVLEIILRQTKGLDGLVFHKWAPRKLGSAPGHGFVPGEPIDRTWWREVVVNRCAKAGVPKFKPHDLRHAAATWARSAGVSPWFVQAMLGHSTINTTELYAHADVSGAKVVQTALLSAREKAIKALG